MGELEVGAAFRISFQACPIGFIRGQAVEADQAPRYVVRAFVRYEVAQQIAAAARNDTPPVFCVLAEGGALEGIDFVANKAGNHSARAFYRDSATIVLQRRGRFDRDRTMYEGPNIARVAAVIGERGRAQVLGALMDGRALTATELADAVGVTRSTMSSTSIPPATGPAHRRPRSQGRHRYFRIANADVADLLEGMMGLAQLTTPQQTLAIRN